MVTTLELPEEVVSAAEGKAAEQGAALRDIVERALRLYLSPKPESDFDFYWSCDHATACPAVPIEDSDKLYEYLEEHWRTPR